MDLLSWWYSNTMDLTRIYLKNKDPTGSGCHAFDVYIVYHTYKPKSAA